MERTHDPPPIADDFTGVDKTDRKRVIFQKAFSKYDVDGDNRMSTNELRNLLGDLRWDNSPSALAEVNSTHALQSQLYFVFSLIANCACIIVSPSLPLSTYAHPFALLSLDASSSLLQLVLHRRSISWTRTAMA